MSGFAVVVARGLIAVPDQVVEPIAEAVRHRGPDGIHVETSENVAMIHARLIATPEAQGERQPFQAGNGTWIVGDLRIDNRAELLTALDLVDRPDTPDIEIVALAHQRWSDRLVDHMIGDFAIVIVEPGGRLRCLRDHLGVKPLYYWCSADWVVIASGMREISAHPAAPRQLDVRMMGEYLSGWVEDAEATALDGARRLPAAHVMTIDDRVEQCRYWAPPLDDRIELADVTEYTAEFRRRFTESVRSRLRAPGPVGCELTGGLDSTSVAAMATRLIGQGEACSTGLLTFSCLFPGSPRADEQTFIDCAVDELDLDWQPVVSDPNRGPWVNADVAHWCDIPLPPDGPDHVALARAAAANGCRVVLTGQGGDNWFDASPVALAALLDERRLGAAWQVARRWSGGPIVSAATTLARYGLLDRKPGWLHRPRTRRAAWVTGQARVAAELDRRRRPAVRDRAYRTVMGQWRHEVLADGYEAMTKEVLDRIAAAGGVEARHPYLDRRLVELAARAPAGVHVTATADRALQRSGLRGLVPDRIVERTTKAAFNEVWHTEIVRQLRPSCDSIRPVDAGWLDPSAVAELLQVTSDRIRAGASGGAVLPLWGIVQVDALMRRFAPGAR